MTKSKLLPFLLLTTLIIGVSYFLLQNNPANPTETTISSNEGVRKQQTEGHAVEVPEDVPEGKIKNYELITENEKFKIRKLGGEYLITLYAIINRPEQYETYRSQLKEYKEDALDYLSNEGINIHKVHIDYEPEEAKSI